MASAKAKLCSIGKPFGFQLSLNILLIGFHQSPGPNKNRVTLS